MTRHRGLIVLPAAGSWKHFSFYLKYPNMERLLEGALDLVFSVTGNTKKRQTEQPAPVVEVPEIVGEVLANELILNHVLSFLPPEDILLRCASVCTFWRDVATSNHLWHYFFALDSEGTPLAGMKPGEGITWLQHYKQTFMSHWSWDPCNSYGIVLSDNDFMGTIQPAYSKFSVLGWVTTRGTKPLVYNDKYYWEIAVNSYSISYGDLIVGVMDASNECKKRRTKKRRGSMQPPSGVSWAPEDQKYSDRCRCWALNLAKGLKTIHSSSRNFGFQYTGDPYCPIGKPGVVVGLLLDTRAGTLSYSLAGESYGVAFEGVTGELFPFMTLYGEAASGSLIKTGDVVCASPPTGEKMLRIKTEDPEKCMVM